MYRKLFLVFASIALVAMFATAAFGQTNAGSVTGTVTDAQGATVPGANVTLESKNTGLKLTTQTTSSGSYSYPNVPVGDYT
ncbi:MAG: carboxypeptidase-like regulatory domain-containing protein, partial [Pyrinomonadaceae bacterium]